MKPILTCLLSTLFCLSTSLVTAAENDGGYSAWQGATPVADGSVETLVKELNELIDQAERARAADQNFLADLRALADRYDWPWQQEIFQSDFTDGKYQRPLPWEVTSGEFRAERGLGMVSRVDAGTTPASPPDEQDLAGAILGVILDQALKTGDGSSQISEATPASMHLMQRVSNAFAVDAEVDARGAEGQVHISLFQKNTEGLGYRLVFMHGDQPNLELQRIGSRGVAVIDTATNLAAPGNQLHTLQWTRDRNGSMNVTLNGNPVLSTTDRGLRDPFDGIEFSNRSGEFALRSLKLSGVN
jgi:hypothetical protein